MWNLAEWLMYVLFILPTLQAKFQSFLLLTGFACNTTNIDWGQKLISSVDFDLQCFFFFLQFSTGIPAERAFISQPVQCFFFFINVSVNMSVWACRPGNMKRLLLLLLGLLVLHQGRCLEFVIDGDLDEKVCVEGMKSQEKIVTFVSWIAKDQLTVIW